MRRLFARSFLPLLLGSALGLLSPGTAGATTTTYSGTLGTDDQVALYTLVIAHGSDLTLETDSYGGGTLGGITTAPGGFVPEISLFNSSGTLLDSDGADQTCSAGMHASSVTGMCDDADLSTVLAAGTYTLALTEFFNVPIGPLLSDGFLEQGAGDFTGPTCGTTGGFFETDVAPCVQLTDAYSVTATVTAVPEPGSLWFLAIPTFALILFGRRQSVARGEASSLWK